MTGAEDVVENPPSKLINLEIRFIQDMGYNLLLSIKFYHRSLLIDQPAACIQQCLSDGFELDRAYQ